MLHAQTNCSQFFIHCLLEFSCYDQVEKNLIVKLWYVKCTSHGYTTKPGGAAKYSYGFVGWMWLTTTKSLRAHCRLNCPQLRRDSKLQLSREFLVAMDDLTCERNVVEFSLDVAEVGPIADICCKCTGACKTTRCICRKNGLRKIQMQAI